MNKETPNASMDEKTKQWQRLMLVLILSAVSFGGLWYALEHKQNLKKTPDVTQTVRFAGAINENDVYKASIESFQSQVANEQAHQASLKQDLQSLASNNAKVHQQTEADLLKKYQALSKQLKALTQKVSQTAQQRQVSIGHVEGNDSFPTQRFKPGQVLPNVQGLAVDGDDTLNLTAAKSQIQRYAPLKTPNTYVPAGTHVLGVLLQGADLVADSYDQSNPKPILIRLISRGTLPNLHHSHLNDCVITAAMTGDISSGRGDVRLERLSCVLPNQSIVDTAVYGTVATHAKEGIAGQVYSREGSRLFSATGAGIAAGVSNGVSQKYVQNQNSIYGPVSTVNQADVLKYGLASGAGSGLNALSQFEMNRANAIYPVIQVNGGKLVTVTFLKGFFFVSKQRTRWLQTHHANLWEGFKGTNPGLPTSAEMAQNGLGSIQ